jgi:ubiquinone/menaquinone biosynthesis C-methylase UbiE
MLARLQGRLDEQKLDNVRLIPAGIGDGELEANTYDRALLVTVLGEIPDRQKALHEVYTALRTGGLLSITEVLPDPHYQTQAAVRNLAEMSGFKLEEEFGSVLAFTINFRK